MRTGLITSKFFSSDIRGLMQDTSIDFVDWCGVISGEENSLIIYDHRINLNALYHDYIENHPGTNNNNKVSRNLFYKWMQRFAKYVTGKDHKTDRDVYGKFMTIDTNK